MKRVLGIILLLTGYLAYGCSGIQTIKALPAPDQVYDVELTTPIIKSFKVNSVFVLILTRDIWKESGGQSAR